MPSPRPTARASRHLALRRWSGSPALPWGGSGGGPPSRDYRSQVHNKVLSSSLSQRRVLPGRSEGAVAERRVQRRLAAILAADVVGYSALMERDEEATYAEFERFKRELI